MYKMAPWSPEIYLTEFYDLALKKGFLNNASQKAMIDCFNNEKEKQVWILHYNDRPIGAVGCHSLEVMGANAYRICARNCVIAEIAGEIGMATRNNAIRKHQNFTDQYYIPACIEWAGRDKDLYITSNESEVASQRLVHRIYCPTHAERGLLVNTGEKEYRGTTQTFWRLDVDRFYEELNKFPRWELAN